MRAPAVRVGASEAPAAHAAGGGVPLLGMGWTRSQLVLRLGEGVPGIEPRELRLERLDRPGGPAMPLTGHARDGEALMVRFNVMTGPGLRPLDSGRWTLTAVDADGARRPVRLARDPEAPAEAPVRFALSGGREYVAHAALDEPDGGTLSIDIRAQRPGRAAGPSRRLLRTLRTAARQAFMGLARRLPGRRRRRVLFMAPRSGLAANLRFVHDRMLERGLDRLVDVQTLPPPVRGRRGPVRSLLRRLRLLWTVARADVLLVQNSEHEFLYNLDLHPSVRFIQLWHGAGAFKAVKYSRVGKPTGPNPYWRKHRNYTHAIVSSAHEVPFFAEAFGIPEERVIPTGIPRLDVFFDERRRAEGLAAARRAYPATEGRFTILFAPTYRGSARHARYDVDQLDYPALHALCVELDAVCIVRMHPVVRHPLGIPDALRDRLLVEPAAPIDVRDLMFAVDLLVTDYSSIMFDFALLRRPMLFFAYDLDEYVRGRDFYEPYESYVPGRIVRTFDELLEAIRGGDHDRARLEAFVERHFGEADGRATDRVIDELVLPAPVRPRTGTEPGR